MVPLHRKSGAVEKAISDSAPLLVVCDEHGDMFEIPEYRMAGMTGSEPVAPGPEDLLDLPFGSDLFMLPGRSAVGYDPRRNSFTEIKEYRGSPVYAAAAFMSPAYLQVLRAAYRTRPDAPVLPLYCYTALGWKNDRFVAAGMRIDADTRQDLHLVDINRINANAPKLIKKFPGNRLVNHLITNCVARYGCPAARNFVLGRWECPLPISISCNAECIGCISKQACGAGIRASHDRISFVPAPREIIEVAVAHLEKAERPVVSFGQGCEGEPLMASGVIEESIRGIRKRTHRGIINLNTNASLPHAIERLCKAGLDSIRVSMNSAQQTRYERYYRPRNYRFGEVVESLRIARKFGIWSSVNYFIFPGLTDSADEIAALNRIIDETRINMIQTRNLNMDPELYMQNLRLDPRARNSIGIREWVAMMRKTRPRIKLG